MWPIWSMQLEKTSCDLGFTEAINKRMQVPSRLKVAEDPSAGDLQGVTTKDCPPSYQMHIPDRILLADMTTNAAFQPYFLSQLSHQPPPLEEPLLEPAIHPAIYGEHPFLTFISGPGSPRPKRLAHQSRARKERALAKNPHLGLGTLDQRQDWQKPSVPPPASSTPQLPLFPLEGRIYSLQNVLQVLWFLGHQMFQMFCKPGQAQCSSLERSVASESSPEDFGTTEVLAMRKQLMKISGRLQRLEKQRVGWHQKELLFYSVLASSCLLNMWLWNKR
ncbi:mitochondrial fission factor homolog A isoform X1 [Zootoca vivipara]|uniref:mitochondrial fission factor homolog A isoform X1 n=1 Tax=Zootoca vivipara TaxID=8524 RepID=UPI001591EE4F|nr:mitochondrial fission factor homolog A isoform X1 [Zootoca vivipara]XP_034969626.1 mitochondrial fission factor homolog A-like isoform X1 [Zootoca vivipara]XP_034969627.1 mitochondrial fission factor homolog A-like isoform X1 [Zootoca vivipara]XP_034969629.1 mitochondrial fission factor homolog A-like isoform X1 [Zootoca vivipara]